MRIRDGQLWRDAHKSFEAYCKDKWSLQRTYVFDIINSAKVVENVRNCEHLPANEARARPFTRLNDPEEQAEVWQGGRRDRAAQRRR